MGKLITTDIYQTAFAQVHGYRMTILRAGDRCEFTLEGEGLDELMRKYHSDEVNVNAKKFVEAYKGIARLVKQGI